MIRTGQRYIFWLKGFLGRMCYSCAIANVRRQSRHHKVVKLSRGGERWLKTGLLRGVVGLLGGDDISAHIWAGRCTSSEFVIRTVSLGGSTPLRRHVHSARSWTDSQSESFAQRYVTARLGKDTLRLISPDYPMS